MSILGKLLVVGEILKEREKENNINFEDRRENMRKRSQWLAVRRDRRVKGPVWMAFSYQTAPTSHHNSTTIVIINHHCGMIVSNQIETGAMDGILLSPDCTHQVTSQFYYYRHNHHDDRFQSNRDRKGPVRMDGILSSDCTQVRFIS